MGQLSAPSDTEEEEQAKKPRKKKRGARGATDKRGGGKKSRAAQSQSDESDDDNVDELTLFSEANVSMWIVPTKMCFYVLFSVSKIFLFWSTK